MSRFRMPDFRISGPLTLAVAVATLMPLASLAQSNAPLTGNMTSGAPAAGTPAGSPAGSPAAAAAPASTLPQAQLPQRPVVQQVQTPMPQPAAQSAQSAQAAPAAAATQTASSAPAVEENFGDVTRALLAAQADGRRAGGALPVLGPVSTAAWNRYLDSFSHPIPEYLQKRVETKNTN
ncbi:DUF3613 domain-containing protein [Achromobacter kerstersii]|jgi:hypothetical protein|uniref:DUF3613 domain-containing protein n=1 Tax=Achromobacter kerstersii TaxID=1353890 RepID=A0A6S7BKU7_9BURK|nr:DUF3613 domain-containing protein [Achromobacter kerstersii]CAB3734521.1 hypothetical protein LMG3441_04990 [Achromobacter kerstersii]